LQILIVCSGNSGSASPFIIEQVDSLKRFNVTFEYFLIKGTGILGYLSNYFRYKRIIRQFRPDIIHAHFGLSGLFACFERNIPIIVTFHGSDINSAKTRIISKVASKMATKSIFVSHSLGLLAGDDKPTIVPCGIDLEMFYPITKQEAREKLGLLKKEHYILFSSSFENPVKNYPLALKALKLIKNKNIKIIELKGYSRKEVALFMNAADVALMTSISEGSPQFIKEAMACNLPIVSTAVGDVQNIIKGTDGCFIASDNAIDIADKIKKALTIDGTNGRESIKGYDNKIISDLIYNEYIEIVN